MEVEGVGGGRSGDDSVEAEAIVGTSTKMWLCDFMCTLVQYHILLVPIFWVPQQLLRMCDMYSMIDESGNRKATSEYCETQAQQVKPA